MPSAVVKAAALGLTSLAWLIAAEIADDHSLAFVEPRKISTLFGAFHSQLHLARFAPAILRIDHQHVVLVPPR